MSFVLFPTQLFESKYIPKEYLQCKFYLIEHDRFYGINAIKTDSMNFNKKKLLLHKASCLSYLDVMKNKLDITYVTEYPIVKDSQIVMFDTVDKYLTKEITLFYRKLGTEVKMLDSPNFMTNKEQLTAFYNNSKSKGDGKRKKRFMHNAFYKYQLKLHQIPYIKKSYDTENRNAIPKDDKIKMSSTIKNDKNYIKNVNKNVKNKYVQQAIEFVESRFTKNYGTCDDFYLPINHTDAKKWFDEFLNVKMKNFAKYQDAIVPEEPFLFHSVISAVMNIGLINPSYIIKKVIEAYKADKISIKDYEAFIRQLIGWREYQRFIYEFLQDDIVHVNYFGNTGKLSAHWYNGTTGIPPVDDAIKIAFEYGFLHHILRLMVICNFMNLCGIKPIEVYKWFMEFSTDSYEWVMIGNVYSMGLWSDGGITMRKPYISSDKYIQKMAGNRYPHGEWENIWHNLYYNFIYNHKSLLKGTVYSRNINYLNKLNNEEINEIRSVSNKFIKSIVSPF